MPTSSQKRDDDDNERQPGFEPFPLRSTLLNPSVLYHDPTSDSPLLPRLPRSPAPKKTLLKPPVPFDRCETCSRPSTNSRPRYSSTPAPLFPLPRPNLTLHTSVPKSAVTGGIPSSLPLHSGTRSSWKNLSTQTSISRDRGRCHSRCTFIEHHQWIGFAGR